MNKTQSATAFKSVIFVKLPSFKKIAKIHFSFTCSHSSSYEICVFVKEIQLCVKKTRIITKSSLSLLWRKLGKVRCTFTIERKVIWRHGDKRKHESHFQYILGVFFMDSLGIVWWGWRLENLCCHFCFSHEKITDQIFPLVNENFNCFRLCISRILIISLSL